jgi:hypothetical protein
MKRTIKVFGIGAAVLMIMLAVSPALTAVSSDTMKKLSNNSLGNDNPSPPAGNTKCGDANGDGSVDISDAVYLISYIFGGGAAPNPLCAGDANGDGAVDITDAVYLINYMFSGGPAPAGNCCEADIVAQMTAIFDQHEQFLTPMNTELQTYADQHGDLEGFVFTTPELNTLSSIYGQLEALINDNHQDPPGDWQGYIGYAPAEHLLNPDRWIFKFWLPHYLMPAFCVAVDATNLAAALWLGAIIGTGTFDSTAMKILYGLSLFLRNGYTGYTVFKIEQRWDQDPTNDDGVKVTFVNLVAFLPFLPDEVDIDAQIFGDVPPRGHGSYVFPNPI